MFLRGGIGQATEAEMAAALGFATPWALRSALALANRARSALVVAHLGHSLAFTFTHTHTHTHTPRPTAHQKPLPSPGLLVAPLVRLYGREAAAKGLALGELWQEVRGLWGGDIIN